MIQKTRTDRLYLTPHAYACFFDGELVFLDLKKDRYSQAKSGAARILAAQLNAGSPDLPAETEPADDLSDSAELGELFQHGLLTTDPSCGKPLEEARRSAGVELPGLLSSEREGVSLSAFITFFCSYAAASIRLRIFGLNAAVRRIQKRKGGMKEKPVAEPDMMKLRRCVETFRRLKPLAARATDRCLPNSLALAEFLAAYGFYPQFCIGVRLHEFSAHAWLQAGNYILDDAPHIVAAHKTILAV